MKRFEENFKNDDLGTKNVPFPFFRHKKNFP